MHEWLREYCLLPMLGSATAREIHCPFTMFNGGYALLLFAVSHKLVYFIQIPSNRPARRKENPRPSPTTYIQYTSTANTSWRGLTFACFMAAGALGNDERAGASSWSCQTQSIVDVVLQSATMRNIAELLPFNRLHIWRVYVCVCVCRLVCGRVCASGVKQSNGTQNTRCDTLSGVLE